MRRSNRLSAAKNIEGDARGSSELALVSSFYVGAPIMFNP